MKPTVISANQASATNAGAGNSNGGSGNGNGNGNGTSSRAGINIPINREYIGSGASPQQHHPHYAQQPQTQPQYYGNQPAYGSPRQQQVPPNQPQQHFQQPFGFEPDMDMDMDNMFPRAHLGRLHNDPFAGFGGTRKRNSLHDPLSYTHPQAHSIHADDDFSRYFDDDADFGFPHFSTLGRRGRGLGATNSHMENDDDFFNRLPSEFRQYIPEGFSGRRTATGAQPQTRPQQQYYQQDYSVPPSQSGQPGQAQPAPQSPSKRLCDAAIQTDDPAGRSEVDCAPVNLNQHGLRNTMDMGVKSVAEQEQGPRSHSAPPPEQQQLNQQYHQQQQQQQQPTNQQRPTPPPQFGTQTSPPVQQSHLPQFHKTYYAPQQQAHPQQKQQTPPPPQPQTPGGSNVRTIPIFVEGRSEPVINAHKEIPNQGAANSAQAQANAQASSQAYYAPSQSHQQQRPAPLNTQQQPPQSEQQLQTDAGVGVPPQTPHTQDSIKKIQDIQRDVLELMAKVEQFKGTRQDKEYVYLDEMLTRNLLKLDTIDTNGKDSIRLARKEAIKCIQASVNVLDAKAEENARRASGTEENAASQVAATEPAVAAEAESSADAEPATPQPLDATKIQTAIPLPPPPTPAAAEGTENVQDAQGAQNQKTSAAEETSTIKTTASTQSSE